VIAGPDIEARVLLSLREDSLASLDALRAAIPGILSSPVQLRPRDRAGAEQAIRRPVKKWSEGHFGDPKAVVRGRGPAGRCFLDQMQQTDTIVPSAELSANPNASLVPPRLKP
jgi:hypothetical protein